MICKLFFLEEAEEIENKIAEMPNDFVATIIELANDSNLIFLGSIDIFGDTIFNVEQLKEVKNELLILDEKRSIPSGHNLIILMNAIDLILGEGQSTYLRISCCNLV